MISTSCREKGNEGWIFGKVLDPQSKGIRRCNRLFLLSCVLGIALDPLFLSVISINPKLSCLYVQKGNLIALTTLRAFIDFAYLTQVPRSPCLPPRCPNHGPTCILANVSTFGRNLQNFHSASLRFNTTFLNFLMLVVHSKLSN